MEDDSTTLRVELDQRLSDEKYLRLARDSFATEEVEIVGRYDVAGTIVTNILLSAAGSALWDLVKFSFGKAQEFLQQVPAEVTESLQRVVIVRYEASGLVYEIRDNAERDLDRFQHARLMASLDLSQIHPDTQRISVNCVEKYVRLFDDTGLRVGELPWPTDSDDEAS